MKKRLVLIVALIAVCAATTVGQTKQQNTAPAASSGAPMPKQEPAKPEPKRVIVNDAQASDLDEAQAQVEQAEAQKKQVQAQQYGLIRGIATSLGLTWPGPYKVIKLPGGKWCFEEVKPETPAQPEQPKPEAQKPKQ